MLWPCGEKVYVVGFSKMPVVAVERVSNKETMCVLWGHGKEILVWEKEEK